MPLWGLAMFRRLFACAALGAALGLSSVPACAQTVVGAIATGLTGKALLDKANTVLTENIGKLNYGGNALMGRIASEMNVLMRAIDITAQHNLDTAVNAMQDEAGKAFYRLAQLVDEFESAQNKAYAARDATVVDIATILSGLPGVDLVFIERINGLAQFDEGGDYVISVTATELKPGVAGVTSEVSLSVDGKPITPVRIERSGGNEAIIVIGRDNLAGHFKPDRINVVPGEVTLSIHRSPWYSLFGWFDETKNVAAPIYISFFPKSIATVTVAARVKRYAWIDLPPEKYAQHTSDDCGNGGCRVTYRLNMSVPIGDVEQVGAQRIVRIEKVCEPLWGPNSCADWHRITTSGISSNKSQASMDIEHWGEKNAYWIRAYIQEYREILPEDVKQTVEMRYDRNFEFVVPKNTTYWRITGRTITGQNIDVVKEQPTPLLKLVNALDEGQGAKRVVYTVDRDAIGMAAPR